MEGIIFIILDSNIIKEQILRNLNHQYGSYSVCEHLLQQAHLADQFPYEVNLILTECSTAVALCQTKLSLIDDYIIYLILYSFLLWLNRIEDLLKGDNKDENHQLNIIIPATLTCAHEKSICMSFIYLL